ncbi:MAG: COQ9 family protein [Pseudomonadota bacterium]
MTDIKDQLIDAALGHVVFDGWSVAAIRAAANDLEIDTSMAEAFFPRGGVDLARAFHARGDAEMVAGLQAADLTEMRFRDRIAFAVRRRLEIVEPHKEAVRRATTLFALPIYAVDGARAVWETADAIWDTLGDPSEDYNWYTKRATLTGVISSTVLYWLGDQSEDHSASWDFLDRRIDNVMQVEELKANVNDNRYLQPFLAVPNWVLGQIKPPARAPRADLPGSWSIPGEEG